MPLQVPIDKIPTVQATTHLPFLAHAPHNNLLQDLAGGFVHVPMACSSRGLPHAATALKDEEVTL